MKLRKLKLRWLRQPMVTDPNPPNLNQGSGMEAISLDFHHLRNKRNKRYSFRRDKVSKIFQDAMKNGLKLPDSRRPEEVFPV